jgi:hypothetical protein
MNMREKRTESEKGEKTEVDKVAENKKGQNIIRRGGSREGFEQEE